MLGLLLAGTAPRADETGAAEPLAARANLTGDWGGRRSELAARGVEFGIGHFGDVFTVADGGVAQETYYAGLLEVGVGLDLEALLGWPGTRAFVLGIGTFGRDPGDGAGSVHAPSNLANVPTGKLLEAWLERDFLDGRLAVLGGVYAVDSEFDVKETAGVFMNGGFGTGLDLSETGFNGPCVYPTTCLGVRVRYQPDETRYFQFALLDGVAGDPDQPRGTQIELRSDDGLLMLGEAGLQRIGASGRLLRGAVGAWHYTTGFERLLQPEVVLDPLQKSGTHGFYALVEGTLYHEPGQVLQGLSGFVRVGGADESVNPVGRYAGAGLVYTGLLPGRPDDVLGLGFSAAFNGDDFKQAQAAAGTPVDDAEIAWELSYWMPLLPWLSLQLDAQLIRNPSTDPAVEDALLFGLRYQVTL
jgi:porin